MKNIEEKIEILEKAVNVIKELRAGKVLVDDYTEFIDNSHQIANILREKGFGDANFEMPGTMTMVPTSIFANFLSIYEIYAQREEEYVFLSQCISALKAGISSYKEDLRNLKSETKNEEKGKMGSEFTNEIERLIKTLEELIYLQLIMNPTLYWKKSRSISDARKKAVKQRDRYQCQLCQEKFKEEELEVDHIFPYSLGGSNEKVNLMTLCVECNQDKGKRLEYYKSDEGKIKLRLNIQDFIKSLPLVIDFGTWLSKISDMRRK